MKKGSPLLNKEITMNIKMISVNYERKFNIGAYESFTVGFQFYAYVDADIEDPDQCAQTLWNHAREQLKQAAAPILAQCKVATPSARKFVEQTNHLPEPATEPSE
jgi:hypothetical protein